MTPATQDYEAIGVFDDLVKAEQTIDELRRAGFGSEEIGIIGHVGSEQQMPAPPQVQAPEDNAVNGFTRGALVGAIVGILVTLAVPEVARAADWGPWFEIVVGGALGALFCGTLVACGTFIFMRRRTRRYVAELEKGHFIVTVNNPARKSEAVAVLRHKGISVD